MFKKLFNGAMILMIAAVLTIGGLRINADFARHAYAEETPQISRTGLSIPDSDFTSASGSGLTAPSGWTGSSLNSATFSGKSGIIDISAREFAANKSKDGYNLEYYYTNSSPALNTSANATDSNLRNSKVLMINSENAPSAYAYKSSDLTVAPNSYYKISVSVLTPNKDNLNITSEHAGAFVKVIGDINVSSGAIFTNDKWQTHHFYIKGHPFKTLTINISLGLGDIDDQGKVSRSQGFALFDTVVSSSLTEKEYIAQTSAPAYLTYVMDEQADFDDIKDVTTAKINNADFEQSSIDWTEITSRQGNSSYAISDHEGLSESKAVKFSSTDTRSAARRGIRSNTFTIERNKYYNITIWQNSKKLTSGVGTSILSIFEAKDIDNEDKWTDFSLTNYTAPLGENSWLQDWKMGSFYIKGSALQNYDAALELWLGSKTDTAKGTVLYDRVEVYEISPQEYLANSSKGTAIDIVSNKSENPAATSEVNGSFNSFTYEGLLSNDTLPTPDNWTALTSKKSLPERYVTSGVVTASKLKDYSMSYPTDKANLLMIEHTDKAASGYSSASVTVAANAYKKVSVSLNKTTDAKVYLYLKSNNNVVARLDNIATDTYFAQNNFSFLIKGGAFDQTVSLEIWLGTDSGTPDYPNHSTGTLFVEKVAISDSSETEFNGSINTLRQAKFDFDTVNFTSEQVTTGLSQVIGWTAQTPLNHLPVTDGVINLHAYNPSAIGVDLSGLSAVNTLELSSPYGLLINSSIPTAYGYKLNYTFNYASDTYYKITVKLITFNVTGGGATLKLGNQAINNINTETFVSDQQNNERYGNDFVDYIFYIKSGSENSVTNAIELWLGNNDKLANRASGTVIFNSIKLETSTEIEYTEKLTLLDNDKDNKITHLSVFALGAEDPTTPDAPKGDGNKFEWWLLPSILFSVFMVMAIVAIIIRKAIPAHRKRARATNIGYDRTKTLHKIASTNPSPVVNKQPSEDAEAVETEETTNEEDTEQVAPKVDPNVVVLPGEKKAIKIVVRKKPISVNKDKDTDVDSDVGTKDYEDYFED